ncbi:MAG: hypothetical protein K1Y36_19370 [Blastocatellia bacterium]|nr:hypothetical protein [Blastocatellia bacterium]
MKILKPALMYFGLVFGTGFLLGIVRVLLLVPRLGERTAELLEMPLMLIAIILAARRVNRWLEVRKAIPSRLAYGLTAMSLVLLADVGVGVFLREMSPVEVFTSRDAVSGIAYYGMLLVFGLMPWLSGFGRGKSGSVAKGEG